MKTTATLLLALLAAAGTLAAAPSDPQPADKASATTMPSLKDGTLEKPDAAWLAKALPDYPLTTCVVTGEKLGGDMGTPLDRVWRVKGQPDRLVRFCCGNCPKDFQKEPAKYLKLIDEAAAAKAKSTPSAKK